MQIISLTPDDDIISVCDRLDWSDSERALLTLPGEGTAVFQRLDLIRLRRYADGKRIEIGLITSNRRLARQARGVGLPTFANVEEAKTSRRGWWRGRRRRERLGLPTYGDPLDNGKSRQTETNDGELLPKPIITPRQWLIRYATILLFFAAGALTIVSFLYLVPRATITLRPTLQPVTTAQQITAVPRLDEINYAQNAIPARILTITQTWKTEIETTGTINVPTAPARGRIVFTNITSDTNGIADTVAIPAGTIVSAADDILFQTTAEVIVVGVAGGTAEADAIALEPGPQGNVDSEAVTILPDSLAELVEARNPEPMAGGDMRAEAAVSEADLARVRSQVLQFLQAVAQSEMETQATEREFLARESLRVVETLHERYSHAVGERSDRLGVEMTAVLQGTAVDATLASGFIYDALAEQSAPGFTLVPDSIQLGDSEVVSADEAGNVTFLLTGEGALAADLDLEAALETVAGQEMDTAVAYLRQKLPLRDTPTAEIWPLWVKRMPYLTNRIQTNIHADEISIP
ncbi:MAG: hypothetical protein GY803_17420 [Chloroflexi bacterium]|nr:hypothetical protein [Chloroflexota bacterium]